MELVCTKCSGILRVAPDSGGKRVRCPQCDEVIYVPMESGAEDQWRMRGEDGDEYGPVSRSQLDEWVADGRISGKCHLLPSGGNQWRGAAEIYPQLAEPKPLVSYQAPAYSTPASSYAGSPFNGHSAVQYSDKTRTAAGLLALLGFVTGIHGIHRFYLGQIGMGVLMLVTFGFCGIGTIVDMVLAFTGGLYDADGRPLRE